MASILAALGVAGACGGDDGSVNQPPVDGTGSATLPGTISATGGMTEPTGTDTDGTDTETTGDPPTNCNELQCSGPGSCQTADNGTVFCECDEGYVLDPDDPTTCVIDESCMQVRFLEDHCRQLAGTAAAPAVALFFGVDFCAGPAVTPEKLDELGVDFLVLENMVDVAKNVESSVTVLDTSVENYVNIVIDVSESLTGNDEFLPGLLEGLAGLIDALEPGPQDPDVYVALHVFARQNVEYVPFTRDLGTVRAALDVLGTDPESVIDLAGGGMGTDLFDATKEGIENTQRIRDLRDAVSWGGVLSTGTVVVITDGKDASNGMLDQGLIDGTTNQVITIGLGLEIEDEQLRNIGRDGNFLAPTGADLADAFAAITTRVKEYPLRSYMLAYCSSTTEGSPTVEVTVQGGGLKTITSAACQFNAELFSSQAFECNEGTFKNECNSQPCGGLTGCGACADGECCSGPIAGSCMAPVTAAASLDCTGQPELCNGAVNQLCIDGDCVAPAQPGVDYLDEACPPGCEPGAYTCVESVDDMMVEHAFCEPLLTEGNPCLVPSQCASLNCFFVDEDNPFEGRRCLPEARIYDHCGVEDSVCEDGSTCEGSTCQRKLVDLATCSRSDQCRHAVCVEFEGGNFCAVDSACYWSWDEKVPA